MIDDNDLVALPGNVHPLARPEFDTGRASSSLPMERMILVLRRSADKQADLDQFLAGLQDPLPPTSTNGSHQKNSVIASVLLPMMSPQ